MGRGTVHRDEFVGLIDDEWVARISCLWPVADGYSVAGGWISPRSNAGTVEGRKIRLPSSPLTKPGLFLSFARLGKGLGEGGAKTNRSIQGWVEQHGVPLDERKGLEVADSPKGKDPWGPAAMTAEGFKTQACRAWWLLDFYTDIRSQDVERIKGRVRNPKSSLDKRLRETFEAASYEWGIVSTGQARDVLWLGFCVLAEVVEESLSGVRLGVSIHSPDMFDPESPKFKQALHCPDLLSAMYLEFHLLMTRKTPMRRCESPICGLPFPLTRKDKRFCNNTCRSNSRHHG